MNKKKRSIWVESCWLGTVKTQISWVWFACSSLYSNKNAYEKQKLKLDILRTGDPNQTDTDFKAGFLKTHK